MGHNMAFSITLIKVFITAAPLSGIQLTTTALPPGTKPFILYVKLCAFESILNSPIE